MILVGGLSSVARELLDRHHIVREYNWTTGRFSIYIPEVPFTIQDKHLGSCTLEINNDFLWIQGEKNRIEIIPSFGNNEIPECIKAFLPDLCCKKTTFFEVWWQELDRPLTQEEIKILGDEQHISESILGYRSDQENERVK